MVAQLSLLGLEAMPSIEGKPHFQSNFKREKEAHKLAISGIDIEREKNGKVREGKGKTKR